MRLARIRFLALIALTLALAARGRAADPELVLADLRRSPERYVGHEIEFSMDLERGQEDRAAESLQEYFDDSVWLTSRWPWVVARAAVLREGLDEVRVGQRIWAKGRMLQASEEATGSRHAYVVVLSAVRPYVEFKPLEGEFKEETYDAVELGDVRLRVYEYQGRKVEVTVEMLRLEPMDPTLAVRVGVPPKAWVSVVPHGRAQQYARFYVPAKEKKLVAMFAGLETQAPVRIWGQVVRVPISQRRCKPGILIHHAAPADPSALQDDEEPEEDETEAEEEPEAPEDEAEEEAPEAPPLVPAQELAADPQAYLGERIRLRLPYQGDERPPLEETQPVPVLRERLWTRILAPDLGAEGLRVMVDRARRDLADRLEQASLGRPLELTGTLRAHRRERGTDYYFVVEDLGAAAR